MEQFAMQHPVCFTVCVVVALPCLLVMFFLMWLRT